MTILCLILLVVLLVFWFWYWQIRNAIVIPPKRDPRHEMGRRLVQYIRAKQYRKK